MLGSRCEADVLRRLKEDEALIDAYLAMDEGPNAVRIITEYLCLAPVQQRKSSRDFVLSSVFKLPSAHGVDSVGSPKDFRNTNQRRVQVAGKAGRAIVLPDVADAYGYLGDFDEGLAVAREA